jgi:hypothetical protein
MLLFKFKFRTSSDILSEQSNVRFRDGACQVAVLQDIQAGLVAVLQDIQAGLVAVLQDIQADLVAVLQDIQADLVAAFPGPFFHQPNIIYSLRTKLCLSDLKTQTAPRSKHSLPRL